MTVTDTDSGTFDLDTSRNKQVRDAVESWKKQLVDFSGQNRLLYYRDLKVGTLDLKDADEEAVAALLCRHSVALSRLFPVQGDVGESRKVFDDQRRRARAIRNKAVEAAEERGITTCFLAVGMATWKNAVGTATPQAPVLLSEMSISPVGAAQDDFELSVVGETHVNPTLVHLLADQFGVVIDEGLVDEFDIDRFDPKPVFDLLEQGCGSVPGFGITPRLVVGSFSYAKLPMVQDLEHNIEALAAHDVIAALAGNKEARQALGSSGNDVSPSAPDHMPPRDEFLVMDADSSQSYAINAAVAGQNLVISGPPGTGKSQTIANLVASLVAHGKSVLFVAEKRAAITAVLDRLTRVGLDSLFLNLHSGVSSRRAFAASLADSLQKGASVPWPNQTTLHDHLVSERRRLEEHDNATHRTRDPWGVSLFDIQSELMRLTARYSAAADTDVQLRGPDLNAMDASTFRMLTEALREYVALGGISLSPAECGWISREITSPEQADAAYEAAQRLDRKTVHEAHQLLSDVLRDTGLPEPESMTEWTATLELVERLVRVFEHLRVDVFTGPLAEMVAASARAPWRKQNPAHPGVELGRRQRRALVKQARQLWAEAGKPKTADLHQALLEALAVSVAWASRTAGRGTPRLPRAPDALSNARGRLDQLRRELDGLARYLRGVDYGRLSVGQLQAWLDGLVRDESTLQKVPRLNELRTTLESANLTPLLDELRARGVGAEVATAIFSMCWHGSILDRIRFKDAGVANFDAGLLNGHAERFREADRSHLDGAAARVSRAFAENLVLARNSYEEQSTLVQQQAARKRGHLPARRLFEAAPDVMTALKPCWAMSPLMVSQLLPGDHPYFDVVVFDEASQVVPADAIPAILRGKQVIVAGDKHQLPPTSFFATTGDGGADEEPVNEDGSINLAMTSGYESILDVLTVALGEGRRRSLTWHYRSHDERLIAFSNAWVYDNSLTTFPGVSGSACLSHVLVDQRAGTPGQQDSVTAEVNKVVELVLDHAEHRPHQSLGVITMGGKHADRIDTSLRERLRNRPGLEEFFDDARDDKFFVKNLERVQGDERDAIILSIGYGKTPEGRLLYRFGPLLQEGGDRRLNVAVTRARAKMTVVSSFSHLDMDPNRSSALGVQMLRGYLQYAASNGANLGDVAMERPQLNPFEIAVRDRLAAAGIPLTPQYGVAGYWIDFAAAHPTQPGRMVLAIEADGATYHSSQTARDRDRLRQEQLERLGWTFHRIWSTDWFTNTQQCVDNAVDAYQRAVASADSGHGTSTTAGTANEPPKSSGDPNSRPPRTPSHCPTLPGRPITTYTRGELAQVIHWIRSDTLLRTEDELFNEFKTTLGFKRRGSRIVAAFTQALADASQP